MVMSNFGARLLLYYELTLKRCLIVLLLIFLQGLVTMPFVWPDSCIALPRPT